MAWQGLSSAAASFVASLAAAPGRRLLLSAFSTAAGFAAAGANRWLAVSRPLAATGAGELAHLLIARRPPLARPRPRYTALSRQSPGAARSKQLPLRSSARADRLVELAVIRAAGFEQLLRAEQIALKCGNIPSAWCDAAFGKKTAQAVARWPPPDPSGRRASAASLKRSAPCLIRGMDERHIEARPLEATSALADRRDSRSPTRSTLAFK